MYPCMEYEFDNAGSVIREKAFDANQVMLTDTVKDYDSCGRAWRERLRQVPDSNNDANDRITLYQYDARGSTLKTVRKGLGSTNPAAIEVNDIINASEFDSLGRHKKEIDGRLCYHFHLHS